MLTKNLRIFSHTHTHLPNLQYIPRTEVPRLLLDELREFGEHVFLVDFLILLVDAATMRLELCLPALRIKQSFSPFERHAYFYSLVLFFLILIGGEGDYFTLVLASECQVLGHRLGEGDGGGGERGGKGDHANG